MSALTVTVIRDAVGIERIEPAWRRFLAGAPSGACVFNDPQAILARLSGDPGLEAHIVVVSDGEAIRCIAPFYLTRSHFKLELSVIALARLPVRMLRLFGEQLLLAADAEHGECLSAVFETLAELRGHFDLLTIQGLKVAEPLWVYASTRLSGNGHFRFEVASRRLETIHQIRFPTTMEAYLATLNRNTRKNLRQDRKRFFDRQCATTEKFTAPDDVDRLLALKSEIECRSWQARTFGSNENGSQSERRIVREMAARGWLRSYVLFGEGKPVAYQHGYLYHGVYYCDGCAYDQEWHDSSPGTVLRAVMLEDLIENERASLLDFGFGDLAYKRSVANLAHDAAMVHLVPNNRWRAVVRAQQNINVAYEAIRAGLMKAGVDGFVRRLLKRKK